MTNSTALNPANAYREISEQFADDAAFLWLLRSVAVNQPHYKLEDMAELENRIQANLKGLLCNTELAWQLCLEALGHEQAGEAFTAAFLAFTSQNFEKIQVIIDHASTNEDTFKGVVSAMGWLDESLVAASIQALLASKQQEKIYLGLAVCSVRRKNPGEDYLNELIQQPDNLAHSKLLSRLLRLIGELKLSNFSDFALSMAGHQSPDVYFWANWALVLLGEHQHANKLYDFIKAKSPLQAQATSVVFKVADFNMGKTWLAELAQQPKWLHSAISAAGYLGSIQAVPWLLEKMTDAQTAKRAGEAFEMITGISLEQNELIIDDQEDFIAQSAPNDDKDDANVDLDEDENLPFPDIEKVKAIWAEQQANFNPASRYLMGIELNPDFPETITKLSALMSTGQQRQRHSVALSLALLNPSATYSNTKARSAV